MSAKALKLSSSESKLITHEWAIVPATGMLNTLPAKVLLVAEQPPIVSALDALIAPSGP